MKKILIYQNLSNEKDLLENIDIDVITSLNVQRIFFIYIMCLFSFVYNRRPFYEKDGG